MQDPKVVRCLFHLASRLEINASVVREARLPHHLKPAKSRMLRHLAELNHILDSWSDSHRPTRRKKRDVRPMITQYDKLSFWDSPFRKK